MPSKTRAELKLHFVKNAIPTEIDFADLLDSQLNQQDDGLFKPRNEALGVRATGDQRRVLRLYSTEAAASPDWMLALNPLQDPNTPASARSGFGITDAAGGARLFIEAGSGRVGIGTNTPQASLDVTGDIRANGLRGQNREELNDYRTVNPRSNVYLHSPGNDRDAWIYRDSADPNANYGIYHRQIDTGPVGEGPVQLPVNSIGFIGGGSSKLLAYVCLGDGSTFFGGPMSLGGELSLGSRLALSSSGDSLVLNPSGAFPSGIHTPGPLSASSLTVGGSIDVGNGIRAGGQLVIGGPMKIAGDIRVSSFIKVGGDIFFGSTLQTEGRMYITGGESCHMRHKAGVIIEKGDGGNGNLTVEGAEHVRIDHPLDPNRRHLVHSALEGPEAAVFYRGEGELVGGHCEVALPKYFEALTRPGARTVLVTPIWAGSDTSALASTAVADGRFTVRAIDARIKTQKFYWEVKGVRRDIDPFDVEPPKPGFIPRPHP